MVLGRLSTNNRKLSNDHSNNSFCGNTPATTTNITITDLGSSRDITGDGRMAGTEESCESYAGLFTDDDRSILSHGDNYSVEWAGGGDRGSFFWGFGVDERDLGL